MLYVAAQFSAALVAGVLSPAERKCVTVTLVDALLLRCSGRHLAPHRQVQLDQSGFLYANVP
eukprot:4819192-Amphidinium_carterae.1